MRFLESKRGNFAIAMALAMVPICGAMGAAVDLSRGSDARSLLQDRADELALYFARQGLVTKDRGLLDHVQSTIGGESRLQSVNITGGWTSLNEYTVEIKGKLPLTLTQVLPGVGSEYEVSARAVARYKQALLQYKPPTTTLLDPEAGDYNRVYAYCFNKDERNNPKTRGRSKIVAVADNGGTKYTDPMPVCEAGQTMSYQLYNVRSARSTPKKWDDGKTENYSYFTDTVLKPAESYDLDGWPILETVLCPSLSVCKKKLHGGIIPYGKNRTPVRATEACSPGKFMYYGWEDRPPGRGSSDKDYDDIQVIVECPSETLVGSDDTRLIE